ncbi:MAG: anaerobic glycerol-3-phosphate dehydrogenase subunit C [Candidatus Methanomethylicaceae archaeon]
MGLEADLKRVVAGDIKFDKFSKGLYSTDASIYQITPLGVAFPKHEEDVKNIVEYAYAHRVPILPRGAGTSLSGQAVGKALILDFTKYMNGLLELNVDKEYVWVQPGLVLDELNEQLKRHNLEFAPDPSSSAQATLGGMIGNNAAGSHSLKYGMTDAHVESLELILSNGEIVRVRDLTMGSQELKTIMDSNTLEAAIYKKVIEILQYNTQEIEDRYPNVNRNASGYNLNKLLPLLKDNRINLSKLIVGSEGTLGIVTKAKIHLERIPPEKGLVLFGFNDLIGALEAVSHVLENNPSAIDMIDKVLLNLARTVESYKKAAQLLPEDTEAILFIEFFGEDNSEIREKIEQLKKRIMHSFNLTSTVEAYLEGERKAFWGLYKAGYPILLSKPGDAKYISFVDDTVVPPEYLPKYVREFQRVLAKYDTPASFGGHVGSGCLHINPLINLKTQEGIDKMYSIAREVTDLVIKYNGAISGEHGDGLAHTQWNRKLYGDQLWHAFKDIKNTFDPQGILNPGKVVSNGTDLRENLRYRPGYRTSFLTTGFSFSQQRGFDQAIELCNGCATCRKTLRGTMCPSYRGLKDEIASTRGRANLMRLIISGVLPLGTLTSKEFKDKVLDLCLMCKACKVECPSGVDMAKLVMESKYQYNKEHGLPLRDMLFGNVEKLLILLSMSAPLSNWVANNILIRLIMDKALGISRHRSLPKFNRQTFTKWFKKCARSSTTGHSARKVAFFYDCYMNHTRPEVGRSAIRVLEKLGIPVVLPDKMCCGRPMLSKGMLDEARKRAQYNVRSLSRLIKQGYDIVGVEPSCIATIRDEYLDLLEGEEAKLVANNTYEFAEYLIILLEKGEINLRFKETEGKITYHSQCVQKAMGTASFAPKILRLIPGLEVGIEVDSSCCGMAGAFGYEKEHYDLSMRLASSLFEKLKQSGGTIIADGASCTHQIEQGMGISVLHTSQVVERAMGI